MYRIRICCRVQPTILRRIDDNAPMADPFDYVAVSRPIGKYPPEYNGRSAPRNLRNEEPTIPDCRITRPRVGWTLVLVDTRQSWKSIRTHKTSSGHCSHVCRYTGCPINAEAFAICSSIKTTFITRINTSLVGVPTANSFNLPDKFSFHLSYRTDTVNMSMLTWYEQNCYMNMKIGSNHENQCIIWGKSNEFPFINWSLHWGKVIGSITRNIESINTNYWLRLIFQ